MLGYFNKSYLFSRQKGYLWMYTIRFHAKRILGKPYLITFLEDITMLRLKINKEKQEHAFEKK